MQLRFRHIARNVLFNWAGTIAGMLVGFLLSPFILHRLGDVAYGIWVLTVSTVGYLNLLDLGMQSSVLRFVSQGHTKGDHQGASEATSAALWVRLQISALALFISAILAFVFPHIFIIPSNYVADARKAILIVGLTTAATMALGVLGAVISALNRYDLQNYVNLLQTAIRVIGIVVVLRGGHGIVAIALCELTSVLVGKIVQVVIARKLYPELRINLGKPKKETLRKIWSYSAYTFLTTIAVQLVYQTDNVVVGAFVSAVAVTYYSIANSLCRYASQIITSMSGTFTPAASTYEAAGDTSSLLKLYRNGTRAMLVVSLPMMGTLAIRGSTFIGLWMGPKYAHSSGLVLTILSIPLFFSFANQTAVAIAFGTEQHKQMAWWAVGEGLSNLVLSVVLVRWYGIYGVAIGTLVPSLIVQLGFWPRYISKLVGLSPLEVLWNIWRPILLAAIPFAVVTWALDDLTVVHSLPTFFVQVLGASFVFFVTIALTFKTFVRTQVLPKVKGYNLRHGEL